MILTAVTVVVGVTVFVVMQRHAQELLSKSLQLSLQNRVQLIAAEIGSGFDRTLDIAARPLLINQLQRVNADQDAGNARLVLDAAAQSFLSTGLTGIAMRDKGGREVAHAGSFAQTPALSVPLGLPGRVHLIWDGQLLLRVVLDMEQAGLVVGQVIAERALPDTMSAFKEAHFVGKTGELALCASFGLNMQCFPTALNPEIFTVPKRSPQGVPLAMTHALEGKTGVITSHDYRKQEVVAAYAPVDDLGLGVVLKMDRAALFAPVWIELRYLIPLLLGVLAIALLLVRWRLTPLVVGLVGSEAQAKKMSASLRDSESRARALLDNVDDGIVSISDSGMIELFNPAAERMFGYRSEEVVGKNLSMLMPASYRRPQDDDLGRYLQAGQAKIIASGHEVAGRRRDGGLFPMDLRISEFFLGGRRQFIGSIRDITERKRYIEALRTSELQLRQVTDTVPALIACLDTAQRFCFHNKAYEEVFSLGFEQINGHTLAEVLGHAAYEDVRDKVEKVLRGHVVHYERLQTTAQGDIRNYAMHYLPRFGEGPDESKVVGFFSQGTDITELKRIDRMKTEFISTVSHELRTPLTSI
ncbi:MAG: PAS domain S-box protein, partial [Polaromonas sp.]|nr:PAS domain S-box protein [Polaromonas sp.]